MSRQPGMHKSVSEQPSSWHALAETEVARLLGVDVLTGLDDADVSQRQAHFGANVLSAPHGTPAWRRFVGQFHQPLVYILLAAAAVTLTLEEYVDAGVIATVVLINAVVGHLQESKAAKAIEALARMVTTEATVRRNGARLRLPAAELVPGDVVLLQSGDKVPADIRLFFNKSLQIDESALTGESLPVSKHTNPLDLNTVLADRANLAFAGTLVTHGQAEGVVWATGNQTETGRIARLVTMAANLETPLTRKIHQFSKTLVKAILILAALTFVVGIARGEQAVAMFMAAVALAVGAIPEGLPAAVTITLAIGVHRMAVRNAIIRKLPAVETLGSTSVICSDKTGTLTKNQMTVQAIRAGGREYRVTGTGYAPHGQVLDGESPADLGAHEALNECLLAGLLCNDTELRQHGDTWKVEGDPTEAALQVAAAKAGLDIARGHDIHARIDSIPFESDLQYMATLHSHHDPNCRVIFKKGALERLLERSHDMLLDDGSTVALDEEAVRAAAEDMAARGMRVLAFARRMTGVAQATLDHDQLTSGLTFLGLQGMIDPPREQAIASVANCKAAGVQVKMITGDHEITARAVAAQLGLALADAAPLVSMTGRQLENTPDDELANVAEHATVFARVAPEQKLKLVRALQQRGHVVAMTGDGVNDAPALKQADIGIAMGISGTEVAKGAADMLLTDDNFSSIEAAVEEGRGVFDNLTKFIVWTLPTNAGEGLVILAAVAAGTALPVLPVHILWINMATAILLGLMLVFEPKERDLMRRRPRDEREPILTRPLLFRTALVSGIMLLGAFGLFLFERRVLGTELATAQTVVMNVIVFVEAAYLLNCRSLRYSILKVGVLSNRWIFIGITLMVAAQLLMTYAPLMNSLFHTAPIGAAEWMRIGAIALFTFSAVEFEKWLRRRRAPASRAIAGTGT